MCGINCCIIDRLVIQGDKINFNTGALADSSISKLIFAGNIKEISFSQAGPLWSESILCFGTSVEELWLPTDIAIQQICYGGTEAQFKQIIKTGVPATVPVSYETTYSK